VDPSPAQTVLHQWAGPSAGSHYGGAAGGAGDIDGDGTPDLIVGAFLHGYISYAYWSLGFVEVRSGSTGKRIQRHIGNQNSLNKLYAGISVGRAGDVNGDGVNDYLYTSYGAFTASFRVVSGANHKSVFGKAGSQPNSVNLGTSILGGVDLNGDGFDDVVAGDAGGGASGTGFIRVYKGPSGALLYSVTDVPGVCLFGTGLASIADMDGDGIPELVVGAAESPATPCGPGAVFVLSGADGSEIYNITDPRTGTGPTLFGGGVDGLGDIDGDTFDDFVVGAYWAENKEGRAYVYSGRTGTLIRELYGSHVDGWFGLGVVGTGDVDGDGVPDVAVAAQRDDERAADAGRVTFFSGATGRELRVLYGQNANDCFGAALDDAGDVDGGGLNDTIIGSPQTNGAGLASVYAHERAPGTYCTALTSSIGCEPTIWSDGTPALAGGDFRLNAQAVHNEQNGLLFWGLQPASAPFLGGVRCVSQVRERLSTYSGGNSTALFGRTDCSGTLRNDLNGSYLSSVGLTAGQTVYAQYGFPDSGAAAGAGLTDALQFTVLP
jgi:hypothetical protein